MTKIRQFFLVVFPLLFSIPLFAPLQLPLPENLYEVEGQLKGSEGVVLSSDLLLALSEISLNDNRFFEIGNFCFKQIAKQRDRNFNKEIEELIIRLNMIKAVEESDFNKAINDVIVPLLNGLFGDQGPIFKRIQDLKSLEPKLFSKGQWMALIGVAQCLDITRFGFWVNEEANERLFDAQSRAETFEEFEEGSEPAEVEMTHSNGQGSPEEGTPVYPATPLPQVLMPNGSFGFRPTAVRPGQATGVDLRSSFS